MKLFSKVVREGLYGLLIEFPVVILDIVIDYYLPSTSISDLGRCGIGRIFFPHAELRTIFSIPKYERLNWICCWRWIDETGLQRQIYRCFNRSPVREFCQHKLTMPLDDGYSPKQFRAATTIQISLMEFPLLRMSFGSFPEPGKRVFGQLFLDS